MKKRLVIILSGIIIVALGAYLGTRVLHEVTASHQRQIDDIIVADIDLSKVLDGAYAGSYKVFPVEVEVKVTVKDHRIIGIELAEHKNGQGTAAEIIPDKVVEEQSLQVDIVTGATSSSKVILKAIEDALNKAQE